MKTIKFSLLALALICFFSSNSFAQNKFVGAKTCGMCHKAKTGNQYKIWKSTPHAKAFETLKSDEAKKIAKAKGLGDPSTEQACLKCHVTAAGVDAKLLGKKYKVTDGVACESCHGAGSKYKSRKIMKNHDKAVAKGLTDFTVKGAKEAKCKTCHNEESPSYKEFKFDEMWAKIKHPLKK